MAELLSSRVSFDQALNYALQSIGKGDLTLKKEQVEGVRYVYNGKDVFVWLPTGFGKSVIYECLPFVFETLNERKSLVLVVSPLVSLMIDQVKSLKKRGVCAAIMSDHRLVDPSVLLCEQDMDKYHLIFSAPEAVVKVERWRQLLTDPNVSRRIVAIAVDEAHCVSKW